VLVLLVLAPHPSLLIMLVNYHLKTLHSPLRFIIHLLVTYGLTFCIFSSLIVCIARDPGPVPVEETRQDDDDDELDLGQALMAAHPDDNISAPGRFCRKCWVPKPERAHHCSVCGRCVLKMGMSACAVHHAPTEKYHRPPLCLAGVKMCREQCSMFSRIDLRLYIMLRDTGRILHSFISLAALPFSLCILPSYQASHCGSLSITQWLLYVILFLV
jgi:hypothetical protein